jgi:hypothetical protein
MELETRRIMIEPSYAALIEMVPAGGGGEGGSEGVEDIVETELERCLVCLTSRPVVFIGFRGRTGGVAGREGKARPQGIGNWSV